MREAYEPSGEGLEALDDIVERALMEDLHAGDVTARCTVPARARARARLVAKQPLVFCGVAVVHRVFRRVDPSVEVRLAVADGDLVDEGAEVGVIAGPARALLAGERTMLNLVQRASGVATMARQYQRAAGPDTRIVDTRKTMPGLRALDRHAVRCGGAFNHRNDLGAGVLIKENHIRAAGGLAAAVRAAKAHAPHTLKIECEVTSLAELDEALEAGVDVVMLDNMGDAEVEAALGRCEEHPRSVLVEVSGGITLERIPRLAAMGVDLISVGALTHSAAAVDLSLLFDR